MPFEEFKKEHPFVRLDEEKSRSERIMILVLIISIISLAGLAAAWYYILFTYQQ